MCCVMDGAAVRRLASLDEGSTRACMGVGGGCPCRRKVERQGQVPLRAKGGELRVRKTGGPPCARCILEPSQLPAHGDGRGRGQCRSLTRPLPSCTGAAHASALKLPLQWAPHFRRPAQRPIRKTPRAWGQRSAARKGRLRCAVCAQSMCSVRGNWHLSGRK